MEEYRERTLRPDQLGVRAHRNYIDDLEVRSSGLENTFWGSP